MSENVELMQGIEFPELPETVEAEKVDYNTLDKKDLIDVIKAKDKSIENYESVLEEKKKAYDKQTEELNVYYRDRINELNNLIKYYERKIKLIRDLIDIETGGEM